MKLLTILLPPPSSDWEVRTGAAGHPLYYDHRNKVVVLDRPGTSGGKNTTTMDVI